MCDGNGDDCKLQIILLVNDFYVLNILLLSEHTAGHPQHLRAGNCQPMLLRFIKCFKFKPIENFLLIVQRLSGNGVFLEVASVHFPYFPSSDRDC